LDGPLPKWCPAVALSRQDGRHSAVALLLKAVLIQVSDYRLLGASGSTFAFSGEITLLNLFSILVLVGDGVANWYFCLTEPKGKDLDVFISFCNSSTSFSALFILSIVLKQKFYKKFIIPENSIKFGVLIIKIIASFSSKNLKMCWTCICLLIPFN
jgi:hypothetical protein